MNFLLRTSILLITLFLYSCNSQNEKLPILGEREAISTEVNGEIKVDTIYKTIPHFSFLNQDSIEITNNDFDESIYIADFFFTSCPSICPIMHRNMLNIYEQYKENLEVKFLSHSIDFKYDTPSVLKEYATKLGVSGNQWEFVAGSKEDIYGIAPEYMVFAAVDGEVPGGYEHQGWFVLIDKEKRIRGAYDGTDSDQVAQLIKDLPKLLAEYK